MFKPIYIHAQALDNVSDDDMYQIESSKLTKISNKTEIQDILYCMSNVASHHSLIADTLIKKVSKKHLENFQSIALNIDKRQVWLKFGTSDKDNLGRSSHIQVLLDLNGVDDKNIKTYIDNFYQGLKSFSQQTGRNPTDIELLLQTSFQLALKELNEFQKMSKIKQFSKIGIVLLLIAIAGAVTILMSSMIKLMGWFNKGA